VNLIELLLIDLNLYTLRACIFIMETSYAGEGEAQLTSGYTAISANSKDYLEQDWFSMEDDIAHEAEMDLLPRWHKRQQRRDCIRLSLASVGGVLLVIGAGATLIASFARLHQPNASLEKGSSRLFSWRWSGAAAKTAPAPTSVSICLEFENINSCWDNKPSSASTPECTSVSGTQTCLCTPSSGTSCAIDELKSSPPTTGRCAALQMYVFGGSREGSSANPMITGTGPMEVYCAKMVQKSQWQKNHLIAQASDGPSQKPGTKVQCYTQMWSMTWHNNVCNRRMRYLGESCWTGGTSGKCASGASIMQALKNKFASGAATDPTEYSTSCGKGVCVPATAPSTLAVCNCSNAGQAATPTTPTALMYTEVPGRHGCTPTGQSLGFIGRPSDILPNYRSQCTTGGSECVEKGKEACEYANTIGTTCIGFAVNTLGTFGVQIYGPLAINEAVCNDDDGLTTNSGWTTYLRSKAGSRTNVVRSQANNGQMFGCSGGDYKVCGGDACLRSPVSNNDVFNCQPGATLGLSIAS